MKKAWIGDFSRVYGLAGYIDHLFSITQIPQKLMTAYAYLSPIVLAEMLSSLSSYKLGNRSSSLRTLSNLETLMRSDDGTHVPLPISHTAWRMLANCQRFVGDLQGAYNLFKDRRGRKRFLNYLGSSDPQPQNYFFVIKMVFVVQPL